MTRTWIIILNTADLCKLLSFSIAHIYMHHAALDNATTT